MKKLLLLFIIVLLSGCSNAEDDQPEDLLPLDFNEITTDRIDNCSDCFGTETENFDKIADFDTYLFDMMLEINEDLLSDQKLYDYGDEVNREDLILTVPLVEGDKFAVYLPYSTARGTLTNLRIINSECEVSGDYCEELPYLSSYNNIVTYGVNDTSGHYEIDYYDEDDSLYGFDYFAYEYNENELSYENLLAFSDFSRIDYSEYYDGLYFQYKFDNEDNEYLFYYIDTNTNEEIIFAVDEDSQWLVYYNPINNILYEVSYKHDNTTYSVTYFNGYEYEATLSYDPLYELQYNSKISYNFVSEWDNLIISDTWGFVDLYLDDVLLEGVFENRASLRYIDIYEEQRISTLDDISLPSGFTGNVDIDLLKTELSNFISLENFHDIHPYNISNNMTDLFEEIKQELMDKYNK